MSTKRNDLKDPKTWEILGVVLAFFAIAKDLPEVLRKLGVPWLCPAWLKPHLLRLNGSSDGWLIYFAMGVTALMAMLLLWRRVPRSIPADRDESARQSVMWAMRRHRLIRIARSLGYVLVREFMLDRMNVLFYDDFRRPVAPEWAEPERWNSIVRFNFVGGVGAEYQVSRGMHLVHVKTHPPGVDDYGPTDSRVPTWRDLALVFFGMTVGPFWVLGHLPVRAFRALRRSLGLEGDKGAPPSP